MRFYKISGFYRFRYRRIILMSGRYYTDEQFKEIYDGIVYKLKERKQKVNVVSIAADMIAFKGFVQCKPSSKIKVPLGLRFIPNFKPKSIKRG